MPGIAVAVVGNVTPGLGSGPTYPSPSTAGTWAAAQVAPVSYPFLTVGGVAVLHGASCVFTFTPTDGTSPANPTSTVTLTATATALQKGSTFVLRNGDSAHDTYGNTLTVAATGILTSA
jgi:hypothetical protein